MRRDEYEIRGAVYVEQGIEWSACHCRREVMEVNVPAGLSIYPQANGSCIEAWVPRMSKFTAISIGSEGWFCISPENRRHNPSASCCGAAIVDYPSPRYFGRDTRGNGRGDTGGCVWKMGVMLGGLVRRSAQATAGSSEGRVAVIGCCIVTVITVD